MGTPTVFVIADLHLGHEKLAVIRGFSSADEHDNHIVNAWNEKVTKRDVVYVLGDVFRLHRLPELKGTKKLALGNHDTKNVNGYADHFSQVRSCFEFDSCLLTHIPVHPSQFSRWELNVHGHTHDKKINDLRYIPVSVEHTVNFAPMPLRSLLEERRKFLRSVV